MTPAQRHVALLRGINVGGGNRLKMADLRALATDLGWSDTATYIASGNLTFSATGNPDALAATLQQALATRLGLDVPVIVLTAGAIGDALSACPFSPADPRHVHVFWLLDEPRFDAGLYAALRTGNEQLELSGRTAWLHAPDGIGRSRLGDRIDRVFGAPGTGRNLRTVRAIADLLR